ncbi:MAG: hypothetical protein NVSMB64_02610 [Candidatus Velthaea sp.]
MTNSGFSATDRLDDQIRWYDRKSRGSQRIYKTLKVIEIVIAASIPLGSAVKLSPAIVGSLGVFITVIEGLIHLNQYHESWISYRSTCEALRREKHLYLANAGPYEEIERPLVLLANRIESIIAQENTTWVSSQESTSRPAAN